MVVAKGIRLGPHETRLLLELEARESDLFTIDDAREILGVRDIAPVLHRLRSKGRVVEVRKGRYLLVPARAGIAGGWSESVYRVVDAVVAGDPVTAEQVTRDHMASVVDALHQLEDMSMPRIMAAGFGR